VKGFVNFNTSSPYFKSNSINVILRPRRREDRVLLKSINFYNLYAIHLRNKAILVADYVVSQGIDVLELTETWLRTDTYQLIINELVPGECESKHVPRKSGTRGGVISILYRVSKSKTTEMYTQFENIDCTINIGTVTVKCCIIYS